MNTLLRTLVDRPSRRLLLVGVLPDGDGGDGGAGGGGGAPPAGDPPAADADKKFSQSDVDRFNTEARERGKRQATQELASKFGMSPDEAAAEFKRLKDAETAKLPELERREKQANDREAAAVAREAAATEAVRVASIKEQLAEAGASGPDMKDAATLIRGELAADADEATVKASIDALKTRRPELFAAKAPEDDGKGGKKPPPHSDARPPVGGRGPGEQTPAQRAEANLKKFGLANGPNGASNVEKAKAAV